MPYKFLFVINAKSGRKGGIQWPVEIGQYFASLPHTVQYFKVEGEDSGKQLKDTINREAPDRVIAVGGDGTVGLVARQIMGTTIPLGILPAGSANGMAKELGIAVNATAALDVIIDDEIKPMDLIRLNDTDICLHLCDIGLNAQLIKNFDDGHMRGKLGYALVAFKTLTNRKSIRVEIDLPDKQIRRNAIMVALANASKYGTGAVINPDGDISDGLFEVIVVRRLAIVEILKMVFNPKPFNPRNIQVFKARSVCITTRKQMHFQIDGEYKGKVRQVKAEIMPAAIQVLVPVPEDKA
jgi:YegS/Rv2252/BmrU family lipid kinase